jgi:hypothetical protein
VSNGQRPLLALATLDSAYKNDARALDEALGVLEEWHDLSTRKVQNTVIAGLYLIAKLDRFNAARMRKVFQEIGPKALIREAQEIAAARMRGINSEVVGRALLAHYNRGLRSGRLSLDDC